MKLEVLRVSSESDSTSGLVFDVTNGRKFLCYSLEDEYRSEKVMHETRVPAGTYKILLRTNLLEFVKYLRFKSSRSFSTVLYFSSALYNFSAV